MAEYEIILTGEDIQAQLNKLCAVEPGVYGKRWNPDGSLTVLVRAHELLAALDQPEQPAATPVFDEGPRRRPARHLDKNPDSVDVPKSDRDLDPTPDEEVGA